MKELQEQMTELVGILRQSEARRKEIEKQNKTLAAALAMSPTVRLYV